MTENNFDAKGRGRESEQHLFVARSLYPNNVEPDEQAFTPSYGENQYVPNELDAPMPQTPITQPPQVPPADLSAYYRRDSLVQEENLNTEEPAFAPPQKFEFPAYYSEPWTVEPDVDVPVAQNNVYRPREVTWASTERRAILTPEGIAGYQVQEDREQPRKRRRRRHTLRRMFTTLVILTLLGAGVYLFREPINTWISKLTGNMQGASSPFTAVTTPAPVKGYNAAPPVEIAERARTSIGQISGTVNMETYVVTDTHVVARSVRGDGKYDFYLFTADEGRLLCYFEGLGEHDMFPLEDGNFYVKQSPFLVGANGSALIRIEHIEKIIGEHRTFRPMMNGWAIIANETGDDANYINSSGQMMSTLWFVRSFPFTGKKTVAYVDTGVTADPDTRYLLYVLGTDGVMTKWKSDSEMTDVVGSAAGMAYLSTGELYKLDNLKKPMVTSDEVNLYLDCDAMVVHDPQSDKYGLFVHGEQHYDFAYDSIKPVACEIEWGSKVLTGKAGNFTLYAVQNAAYPQPFSHYFVLTKDGQEEYVALSTSSAYPILLDGNF